MVGLCFEFTELSLNPFDVTSSNVLPWILPVFYTFSLGTRKSFSPLCTRGSIHCAPLWCTWGAVSDTRAGRTRARPPCTRTGSSSVQGRNAPPVCTRSRCRPRSPCPGSRRRPCCRRLCAQPRPRRSPPGSPRWPQTPRSSGPAGGRRRPRGEGASFPAASQHPHSTQTRGWHFILFFKLRVSSADPSSSLLSAPPSSSSSSSCMVCSI